MMTASGVRTAFGVYVKPMEAEFGWSRAALSEVAALSLLLLGLLACGFPFVAGFLRNEPEERGLQPYGATGPLRTSIESAELQRAGRVSLMDAARVPQLWLLMATQFVCGYTSLGMILTHF